MKANKRKIDLCEASEPTPQSGLPQAQGPVQVSTPALAPPPPDFVQDKLEAPKSLVMTEPSPGKSRTSGKPSRRRTISQQLDTPKQATEPKSIDTVEREPIEDYTLINFEKLSKHPIKETGVHSVKRVKSNLLELWESAIKPLFDISKFFNGKNIDTSSFKEPQFDLDIARFWASVSKRDLYSLSAEAILKYKQFFDNDVNFVRRKLLERPLAVHFQLNLDALGRKDEASTDDTIAYLKQLREKAYLAYHPVIASLTESRNPLACDDKVIHKSLASRLEAASQTVDNYDSTSIWQLLGFLAGESLPTNSEGYFDNSVTGTLRAAVEPQCASFTMYNHDSRESVFLHHRKRLARGSLHWLQSRFFQHIKFSLKEHVGGPSSFIQLGGASTLDTYFEAYSTLLFRQAQRHDLSSSGPAMAWAHLFLLFRCGFYDRMLKYAYDHQEVLEVGQADSVEWGTRIPFYVALGVFVEEERFLLPSNYRLQLLDTYLGYLENSDGNPFRLALYHLLMRDTDQQPPMPSLYIQSTEDFLWWNLTLYQDFPRDDGPTLRALQKKVRAFNPGTASPQEVVLYARMLLLTQQFEAAVAALASKPVLECEALHLACALVHYRLLRVPMAPSVFTADLVIEEEGEACLNIMQLFSRTLPWFTAMDTHQFMDYYSFLPLLPRTAYHSYALECVHNLILGTSTFEILLEPSSILKRYSSAFDRPYSNIYGVTPTSSHFQAEWSNFVENVMRSAGAKALASSDFSLGLDLFFAINDIDAAIQNINELLAKELTCIYRDWSMNLSRLVSQKHAEFYSQQLTSIRRLRDGLDHALARGVMDLRQQPSPATSLASKRLLYLVKLAESMLKLDGGSVFATAQIVGIFPQSPSFEGTQAWAAGFQKLSPQLKELLPWAMIVLSNIMQFIYPGVFSDPNPTVAGISMGKHTKANMLFGIASVATHHPRVFPGGPPQSVISFPCGFMPR